MNLLSGYWLTISLNSSTFLGTQKKEQIKPFDPSVIFLTALFSKKLEIYVWQTTRISSDIATSLGYDR
jgi:hypothetical protein